MKTKLLLVVAHAFIVMVCTSGKLYSQTDQSQNFANPSSASMGLVASVNHSMGNVNVSVPLFNFEHSKIQVPIGISYNTSGIRVEDRPTEMGYGWRLSAGGKITRVMINKPDDISQTSHPWNPDALEVASETLFPRVLVQHPFQEPTYEIEYNDDVDTEPDLFYYEIPGRSGMFVLDHQGQPHTIPYQNDISISIVDGSYITIKDNAGNVYTFGDSNMSRETTVFKRKSFKYQGSMQLPDIDIDIDNGFIDIHVDTVYTYNFWKNENKLPSDPVDYVSTWHLTSIKDYYGNSVTFNYAVGETENITSSTYVANYKNNEFGAIRTDDWTRTLRRYDFITSTSTKTLSSIVGGHKRIAFTIDNGSNCISEIAYSLNNTMAKKNNFSYESFANDRIFLKGITESYSSGVNQKVCSFEYNKDQLLPPHDSYDYDSWGYYNGKNNTDHLPTIPDENAPEMITKRGGADRSPVLEYTKACMLTAIKYNTGGKVVYTYGLNRAYVKMYTSYTTIRLKDIGGLRVEKIGYFDENNREVNSIRYEYDTAEAVLGGFEYYPEHISTKPGTHYPGNGPGYTCTDFVISSSRPSNHIVFTSGAHIMYGKITEIAPDSSKTEYIYSTSQTLPDSIYANSYQFLHYMYGSQLEDAGFSPDGYISTQQTSRYWRYGLLLKTTKYDSNGLAIEETDYNYKHDHQKRTVINGYIPFVGYGRMGDDSYYLYIYDWESVPVLLESVSTKYFDNEASRVTTSYVYDDDSAILRSVTNTDAENNSTRTTYRYAHDLTDPSLYIANPYRALSNAGILAPIETVTYRNNKIVATELTEYGSVYQAINRKNVVLPVNSYYMPLQNPVTNIAQADLDFYNGSILMTRDPRYKLTNTMSYDSLAYPSKITSPYGDEKHYIYGYKEDIVVAEIEMPNVNSLIDNEIFIESDTTTEMLPLEAVVSIPLFIDFRTAVNISITLPVELDNKTILVSFRDTNYEVEENYVVVSDCNLTLNYDLEPDLYLLSLILDPYGTYPLDWDFGTAEVVIAYEKEIEMNYHGLPKFFYTSFEESGSGTALPNAKTGIRAKYGTYSIDLTEFNPGEYVLSYWQSTDGGTNWEKMSENITITHNGTPNKDIGGSFYIDEMRIVPRGARIKTYTYDPAVGKTSEMDHNGNVTYWEYDGFGRVKRILDSDRNLIKEYEYNTIN